jgi:hypothetical protein
MFFRAKTSDPRTYWQIVENRREELIGLIVENVGRIAMRLSAESMREMMAPAVGNGSESNPHFFIRRTRFASPPYGLYIISCAININF